MRIAVNTRLLLKNKLEGIGWFTYETLKRITEQHPEHQFFFIFDRDYDDEFVFSSNVTPVKIGPQARHPILYYTWFNISIPIMLRKLKADLFLSTDGYLSLTTKVKSVNVFHDLNFEHYPEDLPWIERKFYRHFFPKYAHKATRIATVSHFSRRDIVKQYHVEPDKIDVVYNGANNLYEPLNNEIKDKTRQEFTENSDYFIFIGALHPRKNLVNLFKAFDQFKSKDEKAIKLLIVGAKKWWTPEIRDTYENMRYRKDVVFAGRLNPEKLRNAMGSALALTYVSYFEGFGIPIVEAFYCDTPVITANVTSMPEVAGDAALIVDPFKPDQIAHAMNKIATDNKLRDDLIQKGRQRRKMFTWQKSAERLWNTIEKALKS
ncbi:MAG: glycosyltransferase family 4 protein [Bacteroidales bacterium]|nr:glycosyltransferase family 4 protein [Bacteroidales bacterium]